jgi:RPA family protein
VRIGICELLRSEFMRSESDFEPNYVVTPLGARIHRVKIVGTVRSEVIFGPQGDYARLQLDDSTGVISVSAFYLRLHMFEKIVQGDIVQLVATVNEYRGRLELIAECIAPVEPNFWLLHRAEVIKSHLAAREEFERAKSLLVHEGNLREARDTAREIGLETEAIGTLEPKEEAEEEVDISGQVLSLISELDQGGGVPFEEIVGNLKGSHGSEEVERGLLELMEDGEIYEPTVGRYARI